MVLQCHALIYTGRTDRDTFIKGKTQGSNGESGMNTEKMASASTGYTQTGTGLKGQQQ
jgi:hypothetical protein